MMKPKVVGSVLMILGTSIGAGMLALPVTAAQQTFLLTLIMLLLSWCLMTIGALSLLEVNLWLQPGTNMISMAQETLGKVGRVVSWFLYLALLYSLLCAYLSGTGDVLHGLLLQVGFNLPRWLSTVLALLILMSIVYGGIGSVDKVNRGLMSMKLIAYIMLIGLIYPFVQVHNLGLGAFHFHGGTMMVMITSFGYAIIVPSLRSYLDSDVATLKRVVLVGSVLPLLIYIIWIVVVQGCLPRAGPHGLLAVLHSPSSNSSLVSALTITTQSRILSFISSLFVSICVMTSFLGVSLCMFDFMSDGLRLSKKGFGKVIVAGASFLPPLFVVLWRPGIFIQALSYAGVCCVMLLVVLPVLMLYFGRYRLKKQAQRIVPDSKPILFIVAGLALVLIVLRFLF